MPHDLGEMTKPERFDDMRRGNMRVSISIANGGIRIAQIVDPQNPDEHQLDFGFLKEESRRSGA